MTDETLLREFWSASHNVYAIHTLARGDATDQVAKWRDLDREFLSRDWSFLTRNRMERLLAAVAAMRRSMELVSIDAPREVHRRTPLRDFQPDYMQLLDAAEICHSLRGSRADKNADSPRGKSKKLPKNDGLMKLAKHLQNRPTGTSQTASATEFCNGDDKRAKSMLRQLRKYPELKSLYS